MARWAVKERTGVPPLCQAPPLVPLTTVEVVSRPEEFHLRPLAERSVNLSIHPAPIKHTHLPRGRWPHCIRRLLLFPVGRQTQPLDPTPLLQPHYTAFNARTGRSAPVLRIGTLASWFLPLVLLP